jgi:hypothetical protein
VGDEKCFGYVALHGDTYPALASGPPVSTRWRSGLMATTFGGQEKQRSRKGAVGTWIGKEHTYTHVHRRLKREAQPPAVSRFEPPPALGTLRACPGQVKGHGNGRPSNTTAHAQTRAPVKAEPLLLLWVAWVVWGGRSRGGLRKMLVGYSRESSTRNVAPTTITTQGSHLLD